MLDLINPLPCGIEDEGQLLALSFRCSDALGSPDHPSVRWCDGIPHTLGKFRDRRIGAEGFTGAHPYIRWCEAEGSTLHEL